MTDITTTATTTTTTTSPPHSNGNHSTSNESDTEKATNGEDHPQQQQVVVKSNSSIAKSNDKRRRRKQNNKAKAKKDNNNNKSSSSSSASLVPKEEEVEIVYVRQDEDLTDPSYAEFCDIFAHFMKPEELTATSSSGSSSSSSAVKEEKQEETTIQATTSSSSSSSSTIDGIQTTDNTKQQQQAAQAAAQIILSSSSAVKGTSKKQKKRLKRLSIPLLKQLVRRPEAVEVHDVNSSDPYFLVYLKSYRNTVPVPKHWCQKRKYLQNKRGFEKPPFQLPDFIAKTGITKLREDNAAKDEQKRMKQKQRERMQPKMGRVDIDYQILHDAFFRFQTKPKLTIQGDLYYECKEMEVQLKEKKPGQLSQELKIALGMPAEGAPPPWLLNMQRYGPPPAYPSQKIAGLNAPLPPGCSWGFHPGGWGKPPIDDVSGRGLYGDIFGTNIQAQPQESLIGPIDRLHWGSLEVEDIPEDDGDVIHDDDDDDGVDLDEKEGEEEGKGEQSDGISSIPTGLETPDSLDLRKGRLDQDKSLYTVLEQTQSNIGGGSLYGSSHKYVVPSSDKAKITNTTNSSGGKDKVDLMKSKRTEQVNITLNPSDMEDMDTLHEGSDLLKRKYEQVLSDKAEADRGEDVSDVIAEQNKKRKKTTPSSHPSHKSQPDKDISKDKDKSKNKKLYSF
eukprot:TRINITY_DN4819_c0_g1_i4.p1 TRINITY_DN4819_c0_g1~~TRINITY_DN4819_c0_g1_i4.p1  ORF type:complete len:672 (+),score=274.45 TRINITY_DN4819_c0_g1_i4:86-2101(+)